MEWLKDLKDSDKVALAILYTGVALTVGGGAAWVWLAVSHLEPAVFTQAIDGCKAVLGLGATLVTTAAIALRLQPKSNGNGKPPEPPVPQS